MPNSPNHYRRVSFLRAVPGPGGAVYKIGQEAELHWRTADALAASGDLKILPWPDPPKAEPKAEPAKAAQADPPKAEPAKPAKAEPAKPAANKPNKPEPAKAEPSAPAVSEAKAEPKAEPTSE